MSKPNGKRFIAWLWLCLCIPASLALAQGAPGKMREADRQRLQGMFEDVVREIRENYYDPAFAGRDPAAMATAARQRIDAAHSNGEALAAIAQYTLDFDDSHTYFIPPFQNIDVDYGWEAGIVGERGMILEVDRGSDAQKQGVHPGDLLESINGMQVTRDTLWKIEYIFDVLRPQPGLHVVLRAPDGTARELDLAAEVKARSKVLALQGEDADNGWARIDDRSDRYRREFPLRMVEAAPGVLIAKFHEFDVYDNDPDQIISAARKHDTLILDLRGNGGGSVAALKKLLGGLFDKDIIVATERLRGKSDELKAPGRGNGAFTGNVVALIDAQSASASEILARTLQLTGRGIVIGDRSAGSVNVGQEHDATVKRGDYLTVGTVSVTIGDLVMPDGGRLEKHGVAPDILVNPTQADIAAQRDPVLAKALEAVGQPMSAEAAGLLLRAPHAK
ncbi:MAG: S41 family peptidase [Thermomonas sp.]